MTLQRWLVLFLLLGCWLFSAACQGPQVEAGSAVSPAAIDDTRNPSIQPEADTKEYINAWTKPIPETDGTAPVVPPGEEKQKPQAVDDDTDSYIRAYTFPTSSENGKKESAAESESQPSIPVAPAEDETDQYIEGQIGN